MAKKLWVGGGEFILKGCLYICALHKTADADISQPSWTVPDQMWELQYRSGLTFSKLVPMIMGKVLIPSRSLPHGQRLNLRFGLTEVCVIETENIDNTLYGKNCAQL